MRAWRYTIYVIGALATALFAFVFLGSLTTAIQHDWLQYKRPEIIEFGSYFAISLALTLATGLAPDRYAKPVLIVATLGAAVALFYLVVTVMLAGGR